MESAMDRDFDPSAEILVHDFDDERTLEEEETMYPEDDSQAELSSLQKEQDMPLADILASYGIKAVPTADGQGGPRYFINDSTVVSTADQDDEEEEEEEEESEETGGESDSNHSSLQALYPSSSANASLSNAADGSSSTASGHGRPGEGSGHRKLHLMRPVNNGSDDEDEEEETDNEYMPDDKLPWKKAVNVGPQYQAIIPALVSKDGPNRRTYYPDEDRLAICRWAPGKSREPDIVDYLKKARSLSDEVRKEMQTGVGGPEAFCKKGAFPYLGTGALHMKDNERALRVLMECKCNIREALARWKAMARNDQDHDLKLWSEEETRLFENGLLQFGKDFFKLHHFVVRTRSRAELVEYYYFWKKSLRHDIAVSRPGANHRLEKKKFALNPNTTTPDEHPAQIPPPPPPPVGSEMMDHIMDEQQQNAWPCPSTASTYGSSGLAAQFLLSGLVDVDVRDGPVSIIASPTSSPSVSTMNGRVLRPATRTSIGHANS